MVGSVQARRVGDAAESVAGEALRQRVTTLRAQALAAAAAPRRKALDQLAALALAQGRAAERWRADRDRVQAASVSRTRFFAAASHDLRQPLHALSINAAALSLLAQRSGDARVGQLAESIERALYDSQSLLDSLLEISRLDAGVVQPEWRHLDLAVVLAGVVQAHAPVAAQRGLSLGLALPGVSLRVHSDAALLRRVLDNLVGNALKFTRQGGVQLRVEAEGEAHLSLSVEDTGIGIAPADQPRVFEEFFQASGLGAERHQGLGLGLAIVRRIAALLDIGVALHSMPGQGTRVLLRLPLGQAQVTAAAAPPPVQPWAAGQGPRVLLVDNDADTREAMLRLLDQLGCPARGVASPAEALAAATAVAAADVAGADVVAAPFRPTVIVCEHRLRGARLLSVVGALRAVLGPLPALVISAHSAPSVLRRLPPGIQRVLRKPVDGLALTVALRDLAAQAGGPATSAAATA